MSGYELSRNWFDFCFENPEQNNPIHTALYMWICEKWNRLGQKDKFGFPASEAMEVLGVKSKTTYYKAFNDLVTWGFIEIVCDSRNQHSAKVIMLSQNLIRQADGKRTALDSAIGRQANGTVPIDKPLNQEPLNQEPLNNTPAKTGGRINVFYEVFQKWFEGGFGFQYEMQKKDWVGIASIQKFCEKNATSDPIQSFEAVLKKYDKLPPFYQQNKSPCFMASKMSDIVAMLKKPTEKQTPLDNLMELHNNSKKNNTDNLLSILQ